MKMISRTKLSTIKKREAEPWIFSYADLMTNLLAFFMMLLIISMSKSPENTSQKLVEGIKEYVDKVVNGKKQIDGTPIAPENKVTELQQVIDQYIRESGLAAQVSLSRVPTGLELTFEGALMFDTGSADIKPESGMVLENIAVLMSKLPTRFFIDVEGHTDNLPISGRYPSNWELSSGRAGSVVRFLESKGLKSIKMRAIGYANTRPVDASGDAEANRRVVIKVNSETMD